MSMIVEWTERADILTKEGRDRFQFALRNGAAFKLVATDHGRSPRPAKRRRRKHRAVAKIDADMGAKLHRMRREGVTLREIARTVGISVSGAGNYLRRTEAARA